LNDFTSLLQWNRQIYSLNEQNRVENVLPSLREQISTVDRYVSNVSQVKDTIDIELKNKIFVFYSIEFNKMRDEITIIRKIYSLTFEYNSIS